MPEDYEGTAIDPETFGQLDADTEEDVEEFEDDDYEEEDIEDVEEPEEDDNDASDEEEGQSLYNIDGIGEVTADEIKEWRNSGLRQSDYTRKTQELAQQREQLKDAAQIYDYLKARPYLVESMRRAENNPQFNQIAPSVERDAIRDLQYQMQSIKVENELQELHQKYGDFDEDKLFKTATDNNINNLELILKSMMYEHGSASPSTSAIEEAKKQLKAELESEQDTVSTVVTNKSSKKHKAPRLSKEERHVAEMMGMTPREYAKWKNI